MDTLIIKPSIKIVKLIGKLERNIGSYKYFNNHDTSMHQSINELSYFKVDPREILKVNNELNNTVFKLTKNNLLDICYKIESNTANGENRARVEKSIFYDKNNRPLFSSVSPFILESRLKELLQWTSDELNSEKIHPAIIIAVYHLVSLHLQAFDKASHIITLISSWHLLKNHIFKGFEQIDIANYFLNKSDDYFASIKQAEKSCFSNWHSLNFWLEFFLETLITALENKNKAPDIKPNTTQQIILNFIKRNQLVKRGDIVKATGIKLATVKYNLKVLTDRGNIVRKGNAKATTYSLN